MLRHSRPRTRPFPRSFLEWQVELRRHTMVERQGAPHVGVAPLVTVRDRSGGPGFRSHSIICGLLPHPDQLDERTKEFRSLYEESIREGARQVYDRGIAHLRDYYRDPDDFDPNSITTLVPKTLPLVDALRRTPHCALVFYVFDLESKTSLDQFRCLQLDTHAEVLSGGPVYDNVWWHNALFHGTADEHVVVHFRHERSFDVRFGMLEALS